MNDKQQINVNETSSQKSRVSANSHLSISDSLENNEESSCDKPKQSDKPLDQDQDTKQSLFNLCRPFPAPDSNGQIDAKTYCECVIDLINFLSKMGLFFVPICSNILFNVTILQNFYNKDHAKNQVF